MFRKIIWSIRLAAIVLVGVGAGGIAAAQAAGGHNWSGFYVGVQAGGIWQNTNLDCCTPPANVDHGSYSPSGFAGGGYGGYNFQINNFVVGAEADFNGSTASDKGSQFDGCCTVDATSSWNAAVRARAGILVGDKVLLFATGGVAFSNFDLKSEQPACSGECDFSSGTRTGWTVGGGGEMFVTDSISVKAEYLYADYGSSTEQFAPGSPNSTTSLTSNEVRLGVAFHFN